MKKRILILIAAVVLAWNFGPVLFEAIGVSIPWAGMLTLLLLPSNLLSQPPDFYVKFLVGIFLFFFLVTGAGYLFGFAVPRGQKYQTTRLMRQVQALFADSLILGLYFLLISYVFLSVYGWEHFAPEPSGFDWLTSKAYQAVGAEYARVDKPTVLFSFIREYWYYPLIPSVPLYWFTRKRVKSVVAVLYERPLRFIETGRFGAGGSARFAGLLEEWALRISFKKGEREPHVPYFGPSLYSPFLNIGIKGDSHITTIAASRAGKGRTVIIPNLLKWEGSMIVVDPKGTNAEVTARYRESLGPVHIIDPFNVVTQESAGLNCLPMLMEQIKNGSKRIREDIGVLADALVIPDETGQNVFWDESAKSVIAGLIAHLITRPGADPENLTLPMIRELLAVNRDNLPELLVDMSENNAAGGLARDAGLRLSRGLGTEEVWNILSNTDKHTQWLRSPAIQDVLSRNSFMFSDLRTRPTTIYLVIPPELLEEHRRFIRMFINLAINEIPKEGRSPVPIMMILDEFQQLGKMAEVEKAYRLMAGYNLIIWSFFQDLSGLDLYGNSANTFVSNSRAVQVFGLSDLKSLEFINRKIGGRATRSLTGTDTSQNVPLRTTDEVEKEVSVSGEQQYILRSGKAPLVIGKRNYNGDCTGLLAGLRNEASRPSRLKSPELRHDPLFRGGMGGWLARQMINLHPFRGLYDQDPHYGKR